MIHPRIAELVSKATPSECVLWTGDTSSSKYGRLTLKDGKYAMVHRLVLADKIGRPLDKTEFACHHCDTPPCINPHHLFVGSHDDNMKDSARKDRKGKKLSNADRQHIQTLLDSGMRGVDISRMYGISKVMVHHIKVGR